MPEASIRDIHFALMMVDRLCDGCDGNHQLWTIAGGVIAFILEKTCMFQDIDIFVNCNKDMKDRTSYSVFSVYNSFRPTVQVIRVNFNVNLNGRNILDLTVWQMFASYVIFNFDLPICRCALKFVGTQSYILDMSSFDYTFQSIREDRKMKYFHRMLPYVRLVPNLQQQILYNIFVKYPRTE